MQKKELITRSVKETEVFARSLAREVCGVKRRNAAVIALVGDLGTGKTALTKAFLRELGVKRVTSPTFVVMRRFPLSRRAPFKNAYHMDAYRVSIDDVDSLDLKHIINDPENIFVIEWAERIRTIVPRDAIWVECTYGERENERVFTTYR